MFYIELDRGDVVYNFSVSLLTQADRLRKIFPWQVWFCPVDVEKCAKITHPMIEVHYVIGRTQKEMILRLHYKSIANPRETLWRVEFYRMCASAYIPKHKAVRYLLDRFIKKRKNRIILASNFDRASNYIFLSFGHVLKQIGFELVDCEFEIVPLKKT